MTQEQRNLLRHEVERLHRRHELAAAVGPDWFEPGMMEYLDQSDADCDEAAGTLMLRFEARGTRYEGRTAEIERVRAGEAVRVVRDPENTYNPNNFTLETARGHSLGNMPASLCNALAPLYDSGELVFEKAAVSFTDPLSKRSRHAKQAVLFVQLDARLREPTGFPAQK